MRKLYMLLLAALIAQPSARALTRTYAHRAIVRFGENLAPGTYHVRVTVHPYIGSNTGDVYGEPGETVTNVFSSAISYGTETERFCNHLYGWQYTSTPEPAEIIGGHQVGDGGYYYPMNMADGSTTYNTQFLYLGCEESLAFTNGVRIVISNGETNSVPFGVTYDDAARVYYKPTTANGLALLATNSIATAAVQDVAHVEVWPDRASLTEAGIREASRSVVWYCVLYDENREPYRDAEGAPLTLPVAVDWRKSSEEYQ